MLHLGLFQTVLRRVRMFGAVLLHTPQKRGLAESTGDVVATNDVNQVKCVVLSQPVADTIRR